MKRFVIPALFCIDASTQEEAEALAGQMQEGARQSLPVKQQGTALIFLDEKLPIVEVPIKEDEDPPYSYSDVKPPVTWNRYAGTKSQYTGNAVDIPSR